MAYVESVVQFGVHAFGVVTGCAYVDHEATLGTGRADIVVRWPYGRRQTQYEVIELNFWRSGRSGPRRAGLDQLDGYLATPASRPAP